MQPFGPTARNSRVYFLMALCGIVAGICSGLFGVGGGVVLVPILILLFKYTQQTAGAISLVALLLPVGIFGVLNFWRVGILNGTYIRFGLVIAVGIIIGTYIGSKAAINIPSENLQKAFSALLIVVAVRIWFF